MDKTKYEVVLFDLDGTMIDSMEGILKALNYAFGKQGMRKLSKEELLPFIGPPILYTLQMNFDMSREEAENTMVFYHEHYRKESWKEFSVYPDVEFLIKELKERGKQIGLATNKPRHYAIQIIEHMGLKKYFDYIGGSDVEKGIINKQLVIEQCLKEMEITDKKKVVLIGDRHYDVEGALSSGIQCIGVTYGYGSTEEFEQAVAVCASMEEILSFLK